MKGLFTLLCILSLVHIFLRLFKILKKFFGIRVAYENCAFPNPCSQCKTKYSMSYVTKKVAFVIAVIPISILSPDFTWPTPAGVPVRIRSPGSSLIV